MAEPKSIWDMNYGGGDSTPTSKTAGLSLNGPTNSWDMPYGNLPEIQEDGGKPPSGFSDIVTGLDTLSGLGTAYLGFQGLKLSRKQFDFAKDSFNLNFENQAKLVNNKLLDQEYDRLAQTGNYKIDTQQDRDSLRDVASSRLDAGDKRVATSGV